MTQNFVSAVTLPHVLAFLRSRSPALVSGCAKESRAGLYDRFVAALRERRPELLEAAEAAQAAAQRRAEVSPERGGRGWRAGVRLQCAMWQHGSWGSTNGWVLYQGMERMGLGK